MENKVFRTKSKFINKNRLWLDRYVTLPCCPGKVGRPKDNFNDLSYSGKFKRTQHLRKFETNELLFASKMGLRSDGKSEAAKKLLTIEIESNSTNKINRLSDDSTLAMVVDSRLSKRQHQNIRDSAKNNKTDIYPSYNNIIEAKKRCYFPNVLFTEHSVTVELQSLLDHTIRRLLSTLDLENFNIIQRIVLISKWGMDGSSGQAEYKQAFSDDRFTDSNLLLTCVVPIQLYTENKKKQKVIIWNNPTPSSTKLCRPLKIQFLKETKEISINEVKAVQAQINSLLETQFTTKFSKVLFIKHNLYMTMLDMKMISSITDTSSQKCYLCGASPVEMNDLEKVLEKPIVDDYLQYGISSLHAWIRSFEFLLKLSYRLPLEKWQARGDEAKVTTKIEKRRIQVEFKSQLGIIVDQLKQGAGTSNDGNSARAFFQNYLIASRITGLDKNLIYRFYVILQVIASGLNIKLEAFRAYTLDTAKLFLSLYPWYRMPVSVHKILLHGHEIINALPVPIGQLSEEAQEARNKEYRRYREHNSRKCDRISTNIDVFNSLCVSSDPVITSLRKKPTTPKKMFAPEALSLLEESSANASLDSSSESDSD